MNEKRTKGQINKGKVIKKPKLTGIDLKKTKKIKIPKQKRLTPENLKK